MIARTMQPMSWVERWADSIPAHGRVLDVACGGGRHAVFLAARGHPVDAVDRDLGLSEPVRTTPGVVWHQCDLESQPWPYQANSYQGVVVTNYLHRPLFPRLIDALSSGGVLIYATFSLGQEVLGRPRNPAHLLMPGELLEAVRGHMRVVAYEDVLEGNETPARVQRLCAIKN